MVTRLVALACIVAACTAPTAHTATENKRSSPPPTVSSAEICRAALPHRPVVAWADTTVGGLRAYQYGGPVARLPLQTRFPRVPAGQRAAWCWVRQGPQTDSIWGATLGSPARRAITITGPGKNRARGLMRGPPRVP